MPTPLGHLPGRSLCDRGIRVRFVTLSSNVSPNVTATAGARTQGVNTGELAELIAAIRAGATYVNVHSTTWGGGEVRAQINGNSGHQH